MRKESDIFLFDEEIEFEPVSPGIKRKILGFNHEIMIVRAWFEAGAEGYQHEHFHSQATFVESGVFDVTIGGVTKRQKAGDGYYIPPNVRHGAICVEPGILIDTFSPVREDFLEGEEK